MNFKEILDKMKRFKCALFGNVCRCAAFTWHSCQASRNGWDTSGILALVPIDSTNALEFSQILEMQMASVVPIINGASVGTLASFTGPSQRLGTRLLTFT